MNRKQALAKVLVLLFCWATVFTAWAQDVTISDLTPELRFNDTSIADGNDWGILGYEDSFSVFDLNLINVVLSIPGNDPDTLNSIIVDAAGDVGLANDAVIIDRSTDSLGIGTFPNDDLHILDVAPTLLLEDSSDSQTMAVKFNANLFVIEDDTNANIISIHEDAPTDSLFIEADGDISFAGGDFFMDTGGGELGIGTTAPAWPLDIVDDWPLIKFTDNSDGTTGWIGYNATNSSLEFFNPGLIMRLERNAPADSFVLDSNGDAQFGHFVNAERYRVVDFVPSIQLDVEGFGGTVDWIIGAAGSPEPQWFIDNIQANGSISIIRLLAGDVAGNQFRSLEVEPDGDVTLASDAMTLQRSTGEVGIGVSTPSSPLHVQRTDSAQILVENTSAVEAPRELFELSNAGNTKFIITNTQAVNPSSWGFTNNGDDFRISYQTSGVVEMQVFEGGNVTIDGMLTENSDRNAKTAIRDLNQEDILDKVRSLKIQQWQYKDTPDEDHIGPMAQDFRAAFGLGNTDKGIASLDSGGVALASIQALAKENSQLKQAHRELLSAYHDQQQRLQTLEADRGRLANVEALLSGLLATDQSARIFAEVR